MASSNTPINQITPSLLNLPGEVRNAIYSFCVEPTDILYIAPTATTSADERGWTFSNDDDLPSSSTTAETDDIWSAATTDSKKNTEALAKFNGLVQTCRTIRTEFRPVYKRCTTFRICFAELLAFLESDLRHDCLAAVRAEMIIQPLQLVPQIEKTVRDNLERTLIVTCETASWQGPRDHASMNSIMPFIWYCRDFPKVNVGCEVQDCEECSTPAGPHIAKVDIFFTLKSHPALAAWLDAEAQDVKMSFPPKIHIEMKSGHYHDWMKVWKGGTVTTPQGVIDADTDAWMTTVGLNLNRAVDRDWLRFSDGAADWTQ
ncbi:hypothetical protein IQ07DRAFT_211364 [Pyrenochaeta sp. DS3sAY3a]|nr:hypothetical protein IQ07DRAFT_211364 [Pyrenochaeta sp. DS3sAY3a]